MSLNGPLDILNPVSGSLDRVSIKSAERFVQALTIAEILACRPEGDMLLYEVKWANSWIDEKMLKDIFDGASALLEAFSSSRCADRNMKKQNGHLPEVPAENRSRVNVDTDIHQTIKCETVDIDIQSQDIEVESDDGTKGTLYMCDICSVGFYSHQTLYSHKLRCHRDNHVTDNHVTENHVIENHVIENHVIEPYSSNSPIKDSNTDHMSTPSLKEQLWEQADDNKNSSLNNVGLRVENNIYECENCHMTFADEEYLSRHKVRCKNHANSEYRCSVCFRGFTTKGSLELHVSAVHLKKKDFGCSICGKLFSRKHILKIHLATHYGERNHQCLTCGKTFVQKSNYNRHVRIHESKNFGYKCRYCGQTFTQNKHVENHVRTYHAGNKQDEAV